VFSLFYFLKVGNHFGSLVEVGVLAISGHPNQVLFYPETASIVFA
jgi:hypothetical protein